MSDEWNWENKQQPASDEETKQPEVQKMQKNDIDEPEQPVEQEATENSEEKQETYHWVNPEYQKRQQGTADTQTNSYENNNYRENIGSNGYTGGSYQDYHSNGNFEQKTQTAQEEQNSFTEQRTDNQGQNYTTGQRKYGTYSYQQEYPAKPRKKKSRGTGKKFLVTVGLAVVFGVVAGGVMFGVNTLGRHLTGQDKIPETQIEIPSTETPQTVQPETAETVAGTANQFSVSQVASSCMPSVVSITNASVKTVQDFFGGVQQYPMESSGSGIIVGQNEKELLIATNNHVVTGAKTITVAFNDAAVYEAQIKGNDSDNDLAVIAVDLSKMSQETLNSIRVVTIGDSDALAIGEQVVAIGNALGCGQSVTSGWVSAVNRNMEDSEGNTMGNLIQTDAAINPGNSGGALLNMKGELVGINTAKSMATEVEGMGYAIPVSKAKPILDELMNRETRYKVDENKASYIGVTCMNVDATASQMYGIPTGAFVDSVEEGGPAQRAGIQKGDVIVKFDGMSVSGSKDLIEKLEYYEAGETVEVVISRAENGEYKEITVTVTLGRRSEMKQSVEK